MTDKPTPTDAATPECLTCSDHGAVGSSGFDYKTAADFLSGKTVSDEALRKFVAASRGAHDDRAALRAQMLALRGVLASREAEIALLKRSLLDAEAAAPQPAPSAAAAEQQAGVAKEHVRLVRVIADKIEDGTLFRSGIYSNKDLARFVRNVADAAAPQFPTTQAQADSVQEDAADPLQGAANWLAEAHGQFSPVVLSGCLMIGYNRAKRLHDAALAAHKQGEKQ